MMKLDCRNSYTMFSKINDLYKPPGGFLLHLGYCVKIFTMLKKKKGWQLSCLTEKVTMIGPHCSRQIKNSDSTQV